MAKINRPPEYSEEEGGGEAQARDAAKKVLSDQAARMERHSHSSVQRANGRTPAYDGGIAYDRFSQKEEMRRRKRRNARGDGRKMNWG